MSRITLHIQLDGLPDASANTDPIVAGGTPIDGRVLVESAAPLFLEKLELELILRFESNAELPMPITSSTIAQRVSIDADERPGFPFSLTLPLWPSHVLSEPLNLTWTLSASLQERRIASRNEQGSVMHTGSRRLLLSPPTVRVPRARGLERTPRKRASTAAEESTQPFLDLLTHPEHLPPASSDELLLSDGRRLRWDLDALELHAVDADGTPSLLASAREPIAVQLSRAREAPGAPTLSQRLLRREPEPRHWLYVELRTTERIRLRAPVRTRERLDGLSHLETSGAETTDIGTLVGLLSALRHLDCELLGVERRAEGPVRHEPKPRRQEQRLPLDDVHGRHALTACLRRSDASKSMQALLQRTVDFFQSEPNWHNELLSSSLPQPVVPWITSPGESVLCTGRIPLPWDATVEEVIWSLRAMYIEIDSKEGGVEAFQAVAVLDEDHDPMPLGDHTLGTVLTTAWQLNLPDENAPIPRVAFADRAVWAVDWVVMLRVRTSRGDLRSSARLCVLPVRVRWELEDAQESEPS